MGEAIRLHVPGVPAPQGSKRAFVRGGRPVVVDDNKPRLNDWRAAVAQAASDEMGDAPLLDGAVSMTVLFDLPRPKSHMGTGRNAGVVKASAPEFHNQKPDLDKLTRAVCDAMSGIVYRDDSQIVSLVVQKRWVDRQPGASIKVEAMK